jgi:hypothetical protein
MPLIFSSTVLLTEVLFPSSSCGASAQLYSTFQVGLANNPLGLAFGCPQSRHNN